MDLFSLVVPVGGMYTLFFLFECVPRLTWFDLWGSSENSSLH